jgi:hypothetical protein
MRRGLGLVAVGTVLLGIAAPPAGAQESEEPAEASRGAGLVGSRYLPLRHWAYDYLDLLVARGTLLGLQPLLQPYLRIDIAKAIGEAERAGRLADAEGAWVERLQEEFAPELHQLGADVPQKLRLGAEFAAGLKGMSHTHRDVLRPEGEEKAFGTVELRLAVEAPLLASDFRFRWDNHYLNDPQYPDGNVVEVRECDPLVSQCAYRVEEAYVEIQAPYVRLSIGRQYRNWGWPGSLGHLLSPYAYSYDHLGYRFGTSRISLSGILALPTDFPEDTVRYFSTHRLDWQIRDNLVLSLSESAIWGGPNARLDLAFVNPVGIWEISGRGEQTDTERNTVGLAEVWWRPWQWIALYGGLLIDNTRVGEGGASGFTQWGTTIGVQLPQLAPSWSAGTWLSIVNSLAYRSRIGLPEYYMLDNIGLARDKTDVVLVHAEAEWFGPHGLILKPTLDFMWKGEANLTDPWPDNAFTDYPLLLVGVVEKTIRPALAGRWNFGWGSKRQWTVDGIWDLGVNIVKNDAHVVSDWGAEFVGKIGGEIRFSLLR